MPLCLSVWLPLDLSFCIIKINSVCPLLKMCDPSISLSLWELLFYLQCKQSALQHLAKSVIREIRIGLDTVKCYTDTVVHLPTFWNMKSIPCYQVRTSTADRWQGWVIPSGEKTDVFPKYLFYVNTLKYEKKKGKRLILPENRLNRSNYVERHRF